MNLRDLPFRAWLLIVLLAYATATSFVAQAWALQSFRIGIFALLVLTLFIARKDRQEVSRKLIVDTVLLCLLPLWGVAQLALGRTSSPPDTRDAILHWASLAAIFFLTSRLFAADRTARDAFLKLFLGLSVAMAALCLLQLFTSNGRVFWIFDTGRPEINGTIISHNSYSQFIELGLPVALCLALRDRRNAWAYAVAGGVLYASVIGAASRAGVAMCTLELLFFVLLSLKGRSAALALVPVAVIVFTLVVGWERLWKRLQEQDVYVVRREYMEAAVNMIRQRPGMGYGLGAFPVVSDAFAVRDFPFYANHVHDDWLEFAADGGILFAAVILYVFVSRIPAMFRHPWSLGLLAVMIHACVDYPFPRVAVSGWIFALLGLLCASDAEAAG
jgi:O-antigen ligase